MTTVRFIFAECICYGTFSEKVIIENVDDYISWYKSFMKSSVEKQKMFVRNHNLLQRILKLFVCRYKFEVEGSSNQHQDHQRYLDWFERTSDFIRFSDGCSFWRIGAFSTGTSGLSNNINTDWQY